MSEQEDQELAQLLQDHELVRVRAKPPKTQENGDSPKTQEKPFTVPRRWQV